MSADLTNSLPPAPAAEADLGYLFRLAHQRFRSLLEDEREDIGAMRTRHEHADADRNEKQ